MAPVVGHASTQNLEKLSDVVQFHVLNVDANKLTFQLLMQTQNGFKIYADKLKFNYLPSGSLQYELSAKPKIQAHKILDPFYKEEKFVFENGSEFNLIGKTKLNSEDKIFINILASSISGVVCVNKARSIVNPIIIFRNNHNMTNSIKFITLYYIHILFL